MLNLLIPEGHLMVAVLYCLKITRRHKKDCGSFSLYKKKKNEV